MSDAPPLFDLALRHLSRDARQAGIELPDEKLTALTVVQLRELLEALATLAPKVEYPAAPEMRISVASRQYLVHVRDGSVRFSSWSVRAGGCNLTPGQIIDAITGTDDAVDTPVRIVRPARAVRAAPPPVEEEPRRRTGLIVALAAAAIGCPLLTWQLAGSSSDETELRRLMKIPEYRVLEPEPAKRQFERAVGTYETGGAEGDRRLVLRADGTVLCAKYGPGRALLEETTMTAVAAEAGGQMAFLTGNRTPIEVRDASTVVFCGDTYRRTR